MNKQFSIRNPDDTIVWSGDYPTRDSAVAAYRAATGDDTPEAWLVILSEDD